MVKSLTHLLVLSFLRLADANLLNLLRIIRVCFCTQSLFLYNFSQFYVAHIIEIRNQAEINKI